MKYVLPLVLVASAGWAALRETRWDWSRPGSPPERDQVAVAPQLDPPWLTGALAAEDLHAGIHDAEDPHAGIYHAEDPHAGLYGDGDVGSCPRDAADDGGETMRASEGMDPHVHTRRVAPGVELPKGGVPHSAASNGRSVAEVYAERRSLADQKVRVRGTVVKRTDGILGETYLHLRDGSGSAEREDDDLTVTTTEEFELGETVELEGRVRIDQDLGLGYRYAALLAGATRIAAK